MLPKATLIDFLGGDSFHKLPLPQLSFFFGSFFFLCSGDRESVFRSCDRSNRNRLFLRFIGATKHEATNDFTAPFFHLPL